MIVVSDTPAITSLLQIGRGELLRELFDEVVIPEAVAGELRRSHPVLPGFIQVARVKHRDAADRLRRELDEGEAEAIALMLENRGEILLIDERRGRRVAQREGVAVIGLLGALLMAKRRGLIPSLRNLVGDLQQMAGFRVSNELRARRLVMKSVGATCPRARDAAWRRQG